MKTTQYFDYTRKRPDRAQIKEDWIKTVIEKPERIEVQSDGRIRKCARMMRLQKILFAVAEVGGQRSVVCKIRNLRQAACA